MELEYLSHLKSHPEAPPGRSLALSLPAVPPPTWKCHRFCFQSCSVLKRAVEEPGIICKPRKLPSVLPSLSALQVSFMSSFLPKDFRQPLLESRWLRFPRGGSVFLPLVFLKQLCPAHAVWPGPHLAARHECGVPTPHRGSCLGRDLQTLESLFPLSSYRFFLFSQIFCLQFSAVSFGRVWVWISLSLFCLEFAQLLESVGFFFFFFC